MPNYCCYLFRGLLFNFFAINISHGQAVASRSNLQPFENAKMHFKQEIGADAHLYVGKEYSGFEVKITGNPYFAFSDMQNADVYYNGTLYQDIPLLFDAVRQELVINNYSGNARIKLLNEKIKYFIIAGHRFENIAMFEGTNGNISSGLFDIVSRGAASVLVKRAKRIFKALKAEEQDRFIEADEFYIRNGKNFYPVDGKNALLGALGDKKELIKTYIRKNRFSFKKNFEKELIMTAIYYSTLKT